MDKRYNVKIRTSRSKVNNELKMLCYTTLCGSELVYPFSAVHVIILYPTKVTDCHVDYCDNAF